MDIRMTGFRRHPLPAFLGVGAQKGGTTTLHLLLQQHPQVFLPPGKELHYFTHRFAQGRQWYQQQFKAADPGQRCGEVTPYYLFHPLVPERIKALLPDVRLVILLRDPVERALSGYFHSVRLGLESLPLEEALLAEPLRLAQAPPPEGGAEGGGHAHQAHSYLARSRYDVQLNRYEAWFHPDQMLILRSEDLFADPEPIWRRLLDFLALEPLPLPPERVAANAGRGEAEHVDPAVRAWLRAKLEPTYLAMAHRYGFRW